MMMKGMRKKNIAASLGVHVNTVDQRGKKYEATGIFPESLFPESKRVWSSSRPPILRGRSPSGTVPAISRTVRFLSFPISGDDRPTNPLFPGRRTVDRSKRKHPPQLSPYSVIGKMQYFWVSQFPYGGRQGPYKVLIG